MAKSRQPITQSDLAAFVSENSDFAFEMRVLAKLRELEFECEHSGTYRDPVTEKIRQFDIRASRIVANSILALGVECKNLCPSHPLLVSAVPRTEQEAFHDRIALRGSAIKYPVIDRRKGADSTYKPGEMVGKKTDQVRTDHSGKLDSDDQATFEKLNQAVNSCQGLVERLVHKPNPPLVRIIVPVLVVPQRLLWQVHYNNDGTFLTGPRQVQRTTLFLDHGWSADRGGYGKVTYHLSPVLSGH